MRKNKRKEVIALAKSHYKSLFDEAKRTDESKLAKRYVEIALDIAKRTKVRIPKEYKTLFCKNCHSYFTSENSRKRIRDKTIIILCKECKHFRKMKFNKMDQV